MNLRTRLGLMVAVMLWTGCASPGPTGLTPPDYAGESKKRIAEAAAAESNGDLERALALYGSAINIDPMQPEAHYGRARIFDRLDRPFEADQSYTMAVETATLETRGPYLYQRGQFLLRVRRFDTALRDFDRAIEWFDAHRLDDYSKLARYGKGLAELELLQFENAELDVKYLLEHDPSPDLKTKLELLSIDIARKRREFRR